MKNVIVSIFNEESKTYEAMSHLKSKTGTTVIDSASIIKNVNGHITYQDGFGDNIDDRWATGGLIGALIGLLGGPIGMLLGSSLGILIGGVADASDADSANSVIRRVIAELGNYKLALVIVADEVTGDELDEFLTSHGSCKIIRESYIEVKNEVIEAESVERDMAKEAKRRLKEERKKAKENK